MLLLACDLGETSGMFSVVSVYIGIGDDLVVVCGGFSSEEGF